MPTLTINRPRTQGRVAVVAAYDVAADAKRRISLRAAKAKYFHVQALADGSYLLEPRVLVPPTALSPRSLRMLERSVENLKRGRAGPPVDLPTFTEE